MASRQSTVDFILEQAAGAGHMTARKMFGEYGLYCNGKLVALVCNDQLFMKPTKAGAELLGAPIAASPYPGAKPYFLVSADMLEDSEWLGAVIIATAGELPIPMIKAIKKTGVARATPDPSGS